MAGQTLDLISRDNVEKIEVVSPCVDGVEDMCRKGKPTEKMVVLEFTRNDSKICGGCIVVVEAYERQDLTTNVLTKQKFGRCTRSDFFE